MANPAWYRGSESAPILLTAVKRKGRPKRKRSDWDEESSTLTSLGERTLPNALPYAFEFEETALPPPCPGWRAPEEGESLSVEIDPGFVDELLGGGVGAS